MCLSEQAGKYSLVSVQQEDKKSKNQLTQFPILQQPELVKLLINYISQVVFHTFCASLDTMCVIGSECVRMYQKFCLDFISQPF